jgi:hypothetical protein
LQKKQDLGLREWWHLVGVGVPSLCCIHEGTLNASIFWNEESDTGEVVGSLVSGLLTDGYDTK